MGGSERKDVRPGLTVDMVLKQDQRTGRLTRGVVKDVLTKWHCCKNCPRAYNPPSSSAITLWDIPQGAPVAQEQERLRLVARRKEKCESM